MKKVLILGITSILSTCHAASCVVIEVVTFGEYTLDEAFRLIGVDHAAFDHPTFDFEAMRRFDNAYKVGMIDVEREERRDLSMGDMPAAAPVRKSALRVLLDQRPWLRLFTTPRADFAF